LTGIFKGRFRVRYNYARFGYTRGGGKTWHGGIDLEALDDETIYMPTYKGKSISGTVTRARIVTDKSNATWEWGYYVCVQLDANQTPDTVNYLYFCHCAKLLVKAGQKVKSGDALAVMGNTGNAALADPPYKHCHFEVRSTATGKGLDPTAYAGCPNEVGIYGDQPAQTSGEEVLIDVSHHQGAIDWASVPYRAIVRIGYRGYGSGKLMKDEQYDANLAGAKASGKLFGFYFFSQAVTVDEAREEADFCASLAPTGYPLFFDSEWGHTTKTGAHDGRADNLTKDQRTAIAMAFCEKAKAHGFTAGVYTFTSFASTNIDYAYLCEDYIGWLADTRTNYDKTLPRYIHQYGQGTVSGITGVVDLNHLVKTLPAVDKPASKLQVITIGPVSQGDADAIYLLCRERGLTDAGLYKSEWVEG
jgi:GH25 family lysozyme M1 (1,4-beta-N-acetylmuramidase)